VSVIGGIFIGGISLLEPDGHRTGIIKHAVCAASITALGLDGDHQADRRFHGGPEKAVHHYAADNYPRLRADYPRLARELVPGSLGENLSTLDWTEHNVHVGDVFRINRTILQVSQPRSPCWKINHRFGAEDLSRRITAECITGWYYRVLAPGQISVGDTFELIERESAPVSILRFWEIVLNHRPNVEDLERLSSITALAGGWKKKLREREAWLKRASSSIQ